MGRKRTWDEPEMLSSVMTVLRRKGFGHTTVRDIKDATGLHPGSLYDYYGSKDGLFTAAVTFYNEQVVKERIRRHLEEAEPPLVGIRSFFTSTFDTSENPRLGCLLTNSATDAHALDDACRCGVIAGLDLVERGLHRALKRAQTAGDLAPSAPIGEVASQLLALNQGVLVLVRLGTPPGKLHRIVDSALSALVPSVKGQP